MSAPEERGAELLERLLHAAGTDPDELARDARERVEIERLSAFVERCRANRAALERTVASSALVQRVLARTTRDDPSWWGDLRLVRAFVGRRLETSALLRFVAASLIVHLAALPVVAWFVLEAVEQSAIAFTIAHEPESAYESHEPEQVELDFEVDDVQAETDRLEGRSRATYAEAWDVANALAADRYLLQTRATSAPAFDVPVDSTLALLARRLTVGAENLDPDASERPVAHVPAASDDPFARILWVELELDRIALGAEQRAELRTVLAELVELGGLRQAVDEELQRLARHACERARAYGVLPVEPGSYGRAWTLAARAGRGLGQDLTSLLQRRGGRLEAEDWNATLTALLVQRGLAEHPIARAWAAH